MNVNVKAGLEAFLERVPRGPRAGDDIHYNDVGGADRVLHVAAVQRWEGAEHSDEVGLVWTGHCEGCGQLFWQVTPIREIDLRAECGGCDIVGGRGDQIEIAVADAFARRAAPCKVRPPRPAPIRFLKRRGRVENHVIETMQMFGTRDTVPIQELIEAAVASLPAPEVGERDSRRQRVVRSIQQLSKEKDGPLQVKDNRATYFECATGNV